MLSLQLSHINKKFGAAHVIKDVSLEVEQGEFVVFVGPSGCGKSTLLRIIAGLEDATDGDVLIEDARVNDIDAADRGVAMVFQSYALYPHMTVRDNLSFGLQNIRMPKAEINERVTNAATMLQIEQLLERRPKELSGGQRQRVAIGRAITRDPNIFLFDEPLSNLDAELRVQMRVEITRLHDRLKNTMVYVTHDQVEAMTMADKIVVLRGGIIEQVCPPLELYNTPRNMFVAGFIGSPRMNFVVGSLAAADGEDASFHGTDLPPLALDGVGKVAGSTGRKVTLGIRPEDLIVQTDSGAGWPVIVSVSEQHGANSFLHCTLADETPILIHEPGQSNAKAGDLLRVLPRAGHWHLFDENELRIEI